MAMQAPAQYGQYAPSGAARDQSIFLARWLKVWVALLTVVVLVVIVYLFFITNSLASINSNLSPTERDVVGAGSDVERLPDQVQRINRSLEGIDPALKPIPGNLDAIISSLEPINANLTTVAGSLVDTSGMLRTVLGQATDIRGLLVNADNPPDRLGVQNIHQRVGTGGPFGARNANQIARNALGDLDVTLGGLRATDGHLTVVCGIGANVANLPVLTVC